MKRFRCLECDEECDLIEIDDGCYEEFWGAKVWHAQFTTKSECCSSEDYEEIEDD